MLTVKNNRTEERAVALAEELADPAVLATVVMLANEGFIVIKPDLEWFGNLMLNEGERNQAAYRVLHAMQKGAK